MRDKKHFAEIEAARIFWQLASAVQYLHLKGVMHRYHCLTQRSKTWKCYVRCEEQYFEINWFRKCTEIWLIISHADEKSRDRTFSLYWSHIILPLKSSSVAIITNAISGLLGLFSMYYSVESHPFEVNLMKRCWSVFKKASTILLKMFGSLFLLKPNY